MRALILTALRLIYKLYLQDVLRLMYTLSPKNKFISSFSGEFLSGSERLLK